MSEEERDDAVQEACDALSWIGGAVATWGRVAGKAAATGVHVDGPALTVLTNGILGSLKHVTDILRPEVGSHKKDKERIRELLKVEEENWACLAECHAVYRRKGRIPKGLFLEICRCLGVDPDAKEDE